MSVPVVLAAGNPLLDISVHVAHSLLDKYGLKPGNAILAGEEHAPLFTEIEALPDRSFIAGGSAQNSTRACQWMLQQPGATAYIGSVGVDANAKVLEERASADGVSVHYHHQPNTPTGKCAVLIADKERSMVAALGAANEYQESHFDQPEIQALLQGAKFYMAAGFFLTVAPQVLVRIGEHAQANNKTLVLNLGAPFIFDFFLDKLMAVWPYVQYAIANHEEFEHFGHKLGYTGTLQELVSQIAKHDLDKTANPKGRTLICTRGSKPAYVVSHDGDFHEIAGPVVAKEEIVDTNGAGDSFCGGFLAGLVKGKTLEQSVKAGHYTAAYTIRRSGTDFSQGPPQFQWE